MDFLGIDTGRLPEDFPSGELVGALTEEAALAFGLHRGVKVFNGAHDHGEDFSTAIELVNILPTSCAA